jgi:hypothetical protein
VVVPHGAEEAILGKMDVDIEQSECNEMEVSTEKDANKKGLGMMTHHETEKAIRSEVGSMKKGRVSDVERCSVERHSSGGLQEMMGVMKIASDNEEDEVEACNQQHRNSCTLTEEAANGWRKLIFGSGDEGESGSEKNVVQAEECDELDGFTLIFGEDDEGEVKQERSVVQAVELDALGELTLKLGIGEEEVEEVIGAGTCSGEMGATDDQQPQTTSTYGNGDAEGGNPTTTTLRAKNEEDGGESDGSEVGNIDEGRSDEGGKKIPQAQEKSWEKKHKVYMKNQRHRSNRKEIKVGSTAKRREVEERKEAVSIEAAVQEEATKQHSSNPIVEDGGDSDSTQEGTPDAASDEADEVDVGLNAGGDEKHGCQLKQCNNDLDSNNTQSAH